MANRVYLQIQAIIFSYDYISHLIDYFLTSDNNKDCMSDNLIILIFFLYHATHYKSTPSAFHHLSLS